MGKKEEFEMIKTLTMPLLWFGIAMSLILNFNLIKALLINGHWQWIMDNWLHGPNLILIPLYYIGVHYFIFSCYLLYFKK